MQEGIDSPNLSNINYNQHYSLYRRKTDLMRKRAMNKCRSTDKEDQINSLEPSQTSGTAQTNRTKSLKSSFGGSTYSFKPLRKTPMIEIDVSKDNIVEVNEIKEAAKGYAQKMSMKRTKEKVYYGLWKAAFETAIKKTANKTSSLIRVTHTAERKPGSDDSKKAVKPYGKSSTNARDANNKFILTEVVSKEDKKSVIPNIPVTVVQKGDKEVLTLRKNTDVPKVKTTTPKHDTANKSNTVAKKKEKTNKDQQEKYEALWRKTEKQVSKNPSKNQLIRTEEATKEEQKSIVPNVPMTVVQKVNKTVLTLQKKTEDSKINNTTTKQKPTNTFNTEAKQRVDEGQTSKDQRGNYESLSRKTVNHVIKKPPNNQCNRTEEATKEEKKSIVPNVPVTVVQKGSIDVLTLQKDMNDGKMKSTPTKQNTTNKFNPEAKQRIAQKQTNKYQQEKYETLSRKTVNHVSKIPSKNEPIRTEVVAKEEKKSAVPNVPVTVIQKGGKEILTLRKNTDDLKVKNTSTKQDTTNNSKTEAKKQVDQKQRDKDKQKTNKAP